MRARVAQRAAKLSAVESLLWGGRPSGAQRWQLHAVFKRHMSFQAVRMLDVSLQDVCLSITLDRGINLGPDPAGNPGRSAGDADAIGSTVAYRVRSLTVVNKSTETYGVLDTDIQLQGLSIEVTQAPSSHSSKPGTRHLCVQFVSSIFSHNLGRRVSDRIILPMNETNYTPVPATSRLIR